MASMTVAAAFSSAFAPRRRASTRARSRFARPRAVASSSFEDFRDDDARSHGEWGADGIAQNSSSMAAMRQAWEADALDAWRRHGTMNETRAQRLLNLGSRHRRDALGEVYRDPDAIEAMCATIERFLPGVRAGEVFHKCPECAVTCADAAATQRALVLVRESMPVPAVDVRRVVERAPRVLIMTPAEGRNACEVTKALAEALGVELDDESVRDILESAAEVLFEEPATIRNAVREMEPLNRSHPTLASFVAEHAEALVAPGIRASLAQTLAMRKSYRAPPR